MPIILNNSNIGIQYNTGSNYIIETVKSDLYIRDVRSGISSNLISEPIVEPYIIYTNGYYPTTPSNNTYTWTDNGYTVNIKVSDPELGTSKINKLFDLNPDESNFKYHSQNIFTNSGSTVYSGTNVFKGVSGLSISIDLGRYIYPKRMKIKAIESLSTASPKLFKIFASNNDSCWTDNNHSSWTEIHNQTTQPSYINSQYTIINFTSNLPIYRYYTMVVTTITGNYGYLIFSEWNIGGNETIDGILEGTLNKRLMFTYDMTKHTEYKAQVKTGVGGWRMVRFLPPNLGRWYYADYITTTNINVPTIGTPYNYTNEWAVPFGTFDEMFFATFDMTYWLQCLKTSVLGSYGGVARPIIKSSSSSTPYSAIWYNRGQNPEDVWVSIADHPSLVVYGENGVSVNGSLLNDYGGMCVMVRDSTEGISIPNPLTYTLTFPSPTITDINNNSNLILHGTYDINLNTSNSLIITKNGINIPKPTTFVNYSEERMYPPVRNFTNATTRISGNYYGNGLYEVSYSSSIGAGFEPFNCFNESVTAGGCWLANYSIGRYYFDTYANTLSNIQDSFDDGYYRGEWLKIKLPVPIKLTKYSFKQRPGFIERAPGKYRIYGSNDNNSWVLLIDKYKSDVNYTDLLYTDNNFDILSTYIFFALVVNELIEAYSNASTSVDNRNLNFDEWYIYGKEVNPGSLSIRYNLLNPIKTIEGAQWTYNSSNINVYHLGSVGIGTTSPEYSLDVRGSIYSSVGGYTGSGLTSWSITSDRRIKENIVKASYDTCLENVKNIELYNFNFKDNFVNINDKHQLGFIAQEVQNVYPKAVEVNKMKINETFHDILTLNTTQIDYTLYGAVKKLIKNIEDIDIELINIEETIEIISSNIVKT